MIRTLALLLLLISCSKKPTLDTSSDVKFKQSVQKIEMSLYGEELDKFKWNIRYFANNAKIKKLANGTTAEGLNDLFIKMSVDEYIKTRVPLLKSKISELEKEETESKRINQYFDNLKIVKSSARDIDGYNVNIEFNNDTNYTLGGMTIDCELHPTGRKMAWTDRAFDEDFDEGLEPKEKASFKLHLYKANPYGKLVYPKNYDLKVKITNVWDYKKEKIYPSIFSDEKKKELERARDELAKESNPN